MGTHPIFESDFDCLTEWSTFRLSRGQSVGFCAASAVFPLNLIPRTLASPVSDSLQTSPLEYPEHQLSTSAKDATDIFNRQQHGSRLIWKVESFLVFLLKS